MRVAILCACFSSLACGSDEEPQRDVVDPDEREGDGGDGDAPEEAGPAAVCGDRVCASSERCDDCPDDCGRCAEDCGGVSCELWTSSCSGERGYDVCVLDAESGCPEPGYFVGCAPGNTCGPSGTCEGGCVVPEVMLLVDRSSSMPDAVWAQVEDAVATFARRFEREARIGIRMFPGTAGCDVGETVTLDLDNAEAVVASLVPPSSESATPLAGALTGLGERFGDPNQGELVVLITDGSETCAGREDAIERAYELRVRGARVYTIGVGQAFDGELLQRIAAAGGGRSFEALSANGLAFAFAEIASDATACIQPAYGAGVCFSEECVMACDDGYHLCGSACLADDDAAHCGVLCSPCAEPANATALCIDRTCDIACDAGFHLCGGNRCAADDDVTSCGAGCVSCPPVPNGRPYCDGQCEIACDEGYHLCGSRCVSDFDVATCGDSCTPCAVGADGGVACDGQQCICRAGFHDCGGVCVADGAVATCGDRCVACPTTPGLVAECVAGECNEGCPLGALRCADGTCCTWHELALPPASQFTSFNWSTSDQLRLAGGQTFEGRWRMTAFRLIDGEWHIEHIDHPTETGIYDTTEIDSLGLMSFAYTEPESNVLTLVRENGATWTRRTFESQYQPLIRGFSADGAGALHMLYDHCRDLECQTNGPIQYRSIGPGGDWGEPETISATSKGANSHLAVGANGEICAAWGDEARLSTRVHIACRSADGWLTRDYDLDAPRYVYGIAVDRSGTFHLLAAEPDRDFVHCHGAVLGDMLCDDHPRPWWLIQLYVDRSGDVRLQVEGIDGSTLARWNGNVFSDVMTLPKNAGVEFDPKGDPMLIVHDGASDESSLLQLAP